MGSEYYTENQDRFLSEFRDRYRNAHKRLTGLVDAHTATEIRQDAEARFRELLPTLPDLGGDRNPTTFWIVLAAHYIAFFQPMKARGLSAEQCGRLMYDLFVESLDEKTEQQWLEEGAAQQTPEHMALMERWAAWTQKRRHLPGWVVTYVEGDGQDFDYGIDYQQCGALLLFQRHDAQDLAPYFCMVDWPLNKRMATGLVRLKTLAMGHGVCDFRYKKGRAISQDWSTEAPKIKTPEAPK